MQKQGIPVYDHYKMFLNINYNNVSQKRLAKFALIKYRINFWNYSTAVTSIVLIDANLPLKKIFLTKSAKILFHKGVLLYMIVSPALLIDDHCTKCWRFLDCAPASLSSSPRMLSHSISMRRRSGERKSWQVS